MIMPNSRILLAVSGGPDSVCLIHILDQLKEKYSIRLYAFHLNHKLRGKESDLDEKFVKLFCRNRKIPCRVKRIAVAEYAKKHKLSLEQAARKIRYELFEQERQKLKCDRIALGHNANDNVETVILNLVRGSGLKGLCGIPPTRDRIIRPLIETERKSIVKYLEDNRISYRIDSTNIDSKIPRNFVRTKIIPKLIKLNPNLVETISKISAIMRAEENYLNDLTDEIIKKIIIKKSKSGMILDNKALLSYNLPLRRRILKFLMPKLGYDKIEEILKICETTTVGRVNICQHCVAQKEYDRLFLGESSRKIKSKQITVLIGKTMVVDEMHLVLETAIISDFDLAKKDSNTEVFDYDKLYPPFSLRYRRPGDRFVPFGSKEKKLKEVLIDDKIPERVRSRLPLFCDSEGILWILGNRRAERARIGTDTKKFLLVRIKQWKDPLLRID
jgi:tRNA(Ile)-lysidine synthase